MRTIFGLSLTCAIAFVATGCSPKPPATQPVAKEEHDHPEVGPHKGPLSEWGAHDYLVEFTVDHDTKTATAYVLDGKAKDPKPIPSKTITLSLKQSPPVTLALEPKPLASDPAGQSSRFVGKHDALAEKKEFKGTLSTTIDGKPFGGPFEEKDDHDHKH